MYYPRFTKVIIHYFLTQDKTLFWRNKIEMHTSKDDYLINTLRFVSAKEETQIHGAILPESLTIPTKEPTKKSKRVKKPTKKSTEAPARGVVIRESPEMPLTKKKEKVDVTREVPDVTKESSSETEGGEDEEMDYTTSQVYDDVDIRLNELVDTDKGFVQEEGTDAAMINTEVPVTSSSHSSDLAAKFLSLLVIPHTDAEIVSPLDVYVRHEVPSQQTPTLLTVPVSMVKEILEDAVLAKESSQPHSSYETTLKLIKFKLKKILINKIDKNESYLAAHEHKECYEGLKKSYDLEKIIFSNYGKVYLLKRSQKEKDEDPSAGSDQGLKKKKTSKDTKPTKGPKAKESWSGSSKGNKSQSKSSRKSVQSEEPEFEVADSDMP
nr:hypothetical protein [Tanacetum cinerariifolium]